MLPGLVALLFAREDSESFGGTIISNTAESDPGDTPLIRYLVRRHPDTPEIDALFCCHAEPQKLPGGCALHLFCLLATPVDWHAYL